MYKYEDSTPNQRTELKQMKAYFRPCSMASMTASLELKYTAILPLEIREAEMTSLAGMEFVNASM